MNDLWKRLVPLLIQIAAMILEHFLDNGDNGEGAHAARHVQRLSDKAKNLFG